MNKFEIHYDTGEEVRVTEVEADWHEIDEYGVLTFLLNTEDIAHRFKNWASVVLIGGY